MTELSLSNACLLRLCLAALCRSPGPVLSLSAGTLFYIFTELKGSDILQQNCYQALNTVLQNKQKSSCFLRGGCLSEIVLLFQGKQLFWHSVFYTMSEQSIPLQNRILMCTHRLYTFAVHYELYH